MTKIRIIAAVVDTRQLTLYKEDGQTVTIAQGNPELRRVLDEVLPIVSNGGVAEVDMSPTIVAPNHYSDFEEKSGGLVRLFRVAKKKVASFFANPHDKEADAVPNMVIGTIPGEKPAETQTPEAPAPLSAAVEEIMANAVPVSQAGFTNETLKSDTVIAVVDGKVIPGMENLQRQFANANKLGSVMGVQKFLERIATVIDQRGHSVHDLLRFMERGDLPIADDGSIIIYKVLTSSGHKGKEYPDYFFDIHSGNVPQKIGTYVHMDPSLVDHNRRNECSNGLHVARRSYIRGFRGDVCVLAKVAPEDVIAVPDYDANKMRVCGYHIISRLPAAAHDKLRQDQAMTDIPEAAKMLGAAIAGNHVGVLEKVKITAARGGGIEITDKTGGAVVSVPKVTTKKAVAIEIEEPVEDFSAPKVDPKAIAKETMVLEQAPVTEPAAKAEPTRNERARALFVAKEMGELRALKKASKVSWDKLGFTPDEAQIIVESSDKPKPKKAKADTKPLVAAAKEAEKLNKPVKVKIRKEKASKVLAPVAATDPASMTRQEQAADAFLREDWAALVALKKKSKLGWTKLGFGEADVAVILKNIGG